MKIEEHVPLASLTTFNVGGPARYVVTIESADDAPKALAFAREKKLPLIPLGGGSNILARDEPLDAVLLTVRMKHIRIEGTAVHVDAGASWDSLVEATVQHDLWGIENLSAIPGTVGGAVVQNVGAYGQALSETLSEVLVFDTTDGQIKTISRDAYAHGYRTTIFKNERDRYIVLSATLVLSRTPAPRLSYADLAHYFNGTQATLREIRDAVIAIRSKKFPPLTEFGTAGSFFLNPIVDVEAAKEFQSRYPGMPVFDLPEGGIKIPLGWFFEHVLALKGTVEHGVEAWRNQALVLVTHKGARAEDVKNFSEKIIARTKKELNIDIQPEVRLL